MGRGRLSLGRRRGRRCCATNGDAIGGALAFTEPINSVRAGEAGGPLLLPWGKHSTATLLARRPFHLVKARLAVVSPTGFEPALPP